MIDSAILEAFFEECEDLLVALSDGLADMRDGNADSETVNAVFRSVHSIKGAAGAFNLDELVGFAHTFETVLDELRANRLSTDDTLLRVLQRAGDILADLVDAARDQVPADRAQVDPALSELQSFLGTSVAEEEEFVFEALTLSMDGPERLGSYLIQFQPGRAFYATGNDPALLISALQDLGPVQVHAETSGLTDDLTSLQWDEGYLTWKVELADQKNDLAIRDVFQGTSIFDLFRNDEASASACSVYWNGLAARFLCQA